MTGTTSTAASVIAGVVAAAMMEDHQANVLEGQRAAIFDINRQKQEGYDSLMMGNSLASVQSQERRWLRFTRLCAVTGKVVPASPDLSFYCDFITYHFHNRKSRSVYDRKGLGDAFELQSRYMLPRHVWPRIGYVDWVGLSRARGTRWVPKCECSRGRALRCGRV